MRSVPRSWHFGNNAYVNVGGFNNTIVGSVKVSAGTYLFHAKTTVYNSSQGDSFECRIQDLNGNLDDGYAATQAAFEHMTVALQGFATYAAKTTVNLRFDASDANSVAGWRRLDAIRVDVVH